MISTYHRVQRRLLRWLGLSLPLVWVASSSMAAVLALEEFDGGPNGWAGRDALMTVNHNAIGEWMVAEFASQVFAVPQTDAFRLASGTDFLGDYVTPGLTQISFDLFAANVLPSDLFIRLIDGANVFSYQLSMGSVAQWQTHTVNLTWSFGWSGSSESAFNTALAGVDAIEIQLTRSGTGQQAYYLDNVRTLDTDIGLGDENGGGPSAVPEPGTMTLLVLGIGLSLTRRRRSRLRIGITSS